MMIGSMNNWMNTISFSNAGSIKIVLSGRALTRPGTLHARMLCYVNREPMTPEVTWP